MKEPSRETQIDLNSDQRVPQNFSSLRVPTFDLFLGEPPSLGFKICPLSPRGLQDLSGKRGKGTYVEEISSHEASDDSGHSPLAFAVRYQKTHSDVKDVCVNITPLDQRRDCNNSCLIFSDQRKQS